MHRIDINENILKTNDEIAQKNSSIFKDHGIYVCNIMSAPGAGKTSLIENTIKALKNKYKIAVIEGDIQGDDDANRIKKLSIPVVSINTGGACHLNAHMVMGALHDLDLHNLDIIIIENVGNLVCPAEFNLGEKDKIMLLSITEGDDKPGKYPLMFSRSKALLINKIDLSAHCDASPAKVEKKSRLINPELVCFKISSKTGVNLDLWFSWLEKQINMEKQNVSCCTG